MHQLATTAARTALLTAALALGLTGCGGEEEVAMEGSESGGGTCTWGHSEWDECTWGQ